MKIALLTIATLLLAYAMPHIPESDAKFILSITLGVMVGLTIRMIAITPNPTPKPVAWSVIDTQAESEPACH